MDGHPLTKLTDKLDRLIGWLAAAALGLCLALLAFSVFARYVVPSLQPIWVFEVCIILLVWAILLGVVRVEKRGEHIRVDFLFNLFGRRGRFLAELLSLVFAFAVAILFIYSGWIVVAEAMQWEEMTEAGLPLWILYAALSVSFAIHLLFILERMRLLLTGGESALMRNSQSD
ncbi:MAG: TRAP transporter small permease [Gammaproteobacteria bacterium]|nr:TRAP transporter small permease [Gammaproteobacteria bacterium]